MDLQCGREVIEGCGAWHYAIEIYIGFIVVRFKGGTWYFMHCIAGEMLFSPSRKALV